MENLLILKNQKIENIIIYFNDNEKEIQNYFLNRKDNVSKINIKIDYQIKSFKKLFIGCSLIECICFKKFHRKKH